MSERETVIYQTPLPKKSKFHEMSDRFQDRQEQLHFPYETLEFDFLAVPLLNLISDQHAGNKFTDYARIEQETDEIIKTPNSYVIMLGDYIDNVNWNPGQLEEMEQTPEQVEYLRSYFDYLASYKKLLVILQGDHDGWLKKAGFDLMAEAAERWNAHASHGVTQVIANVGRQEYRLGLAHQLPGHSMYNRTHPQKRASIFGGLRGADLIASGHNHQKGYSLDYQQEFDGDREVHLLALGSYKSTDGWLAKKGFKKQQPEQMYGAAVKLSADRKQITYFPDIVQANQQHRGED